ncbi:MAG: hypothetical protein WKF47_15725 [Geodermatophilaceae bacterium]
MTTAWTSDWWMMTIVGPGPGRQLAAGLAGSIVEVDRHSLALHGGQPGRAGAQFGNGAGDGSPGVEILGPGQRGPGLLLELGQGARLLVGTPLLVVDQSDQAGFGPGPKRRTACGDGGRGEQESHQDGAEHGQAAPHRRPTHCSPPRSAFRCTERAPRPCRMLASAQLR